MVSWVHLDSWHRSVELFTLYLNLVTSSLMQMYPSKQHTEPRLEKHRNVSFPGSHCEYNNEVHSPLQFTVYAVIPHSNCPTATRARMFAKLHFKTNNILTGTFAQPFQWYSTTRHRYTVLTFIFKANSFILELSRSWRPEQGVFQARSSPEMQSIAGTVSYFKRVINSILRTK